MSDEPGRAQFMPCVFHGKVGETAGGNQLDGRFKAGCEWCLLATISNLLIVVQGLEARLAHTQAVGVRPARADREVTP